MDYISEKLQDIQESLDIVVDTHFEQKYLLKQLTQSVQSNRSRIENVEQFKSDFDKHMNQLSGAIKLVKALSFSAATVASMITLYIFWK